MEHITPFEHTFKSHTGALSGFLQSRGIHFPGRAAEGVVYKELLRQSSMMAFNDVFYVTMVIMLCTIPIVFLLKNKKERSSGPHQIAE